MTIDEAIKRCEEEAEKYMEYGIETECYQCAKEHEQLAEWLKELKEAKRLLRLAVEDMNSNNICFDINACNVCTEKNCISCDTFHWRYTDEAEKLLGGSENG